MEHDEENLMPMHALALSDEFHRGLAEVGNTRCCLMYDQTTGPPADDKMTAGWTQEGGSWIEVPVRHPQMDRSMWPLWLPIDVQTAHGSHTIQTSLAVALSELRPEALRSGAGRRIGGWLCLHDGQSIPQAATQFGLSMLQSPPQGGTVLLRLYDPAVLWIVWMLLDAEQQAALLGAIRQYWFLNPMGRLCKLESKSTSKDTLRLRNDQWRDVMLVQPLNQALRVWLDEIAAVRDDPQHLDALCSTAMEALRRGVAHGLSDYMDLAAFAGHALSIHSHFDEHPAVQELLRRRKVDDEHYTSAIEVLTSADWQKISSDQRQVHRT